MRKLRNPTGTHDVMLNLNKCMPHILRTIGIQLSHNQRVLLWLHCESPYGTYRKRGLYLYTMTLEAHHGNKIYNILSLLDRPNFILERNVK